MKIITVLQFTKFLNSDDRPDNLFENAYKSGYWNVYKFNQEAVDYLVENDIKFIIEE